MKPTVRVLSTGGTIAGTKGDAGVSPSKRGSELLSSVPEIDEYATIETEQVVQLPSSNMSLDAVANVAERARAAEADGADGVVVTHGTDTMEESAYYLDLVLRLDIPLVFTGAMRHSDAVSPDGPANILASVRALVDDTLKDSEGVYIALNDELHAARDATKMHTSKLDTFDSPNHGPVATVTPDGLLFHRSPGTDSVHIPVENTSKRVEIVQSGVGVDGQQFDSAVSRGVSGVVLEGTGIGHATRKLADSVAAATQASVPVVLTSRCPAGNISDVYETGRILRENGAISGGMLSAQKARIKLLLALEYAENRDELLELF